MKYSEAITAELMLLMKHDPQVILLGVGVGDSRYGGKDIYGTVAPLTAAYPERVIDTPLSELMLTSALVGMAANGLHPIMIHARADFLYLAAEGLLNTAATWKMIHGTPCSVTVVAVIGEGWGAGPQHTKAPLEMFNVSGINLFTPTSRHDLNKAFNNAVLTGNPTVIMLRRRLYDLDVPNWDTKRQDVDWTIKRGPAPASLLLEAAYYGRATPQTGGF